MTSTSTDEIADIAVVDRIRQSFRRQGLMGLIGAELTHVAPGLVRIAMTCSDAVSQQQGYVHAGATSAIADSAGGYAALTLMPDGSEVLTVDYHLNLVAPADGDYLEATGTVIKSGRTLSVCRLEVHAVTAEARKLVATGQQTLIRVDASTSRTARSPARTAPSM